MTSKSWWLPYTNPTGNLISLSEQQLLDCAQGTNGCNGGWMDNTFKYIVENQGISSEASYQYEQREEACNEALGKAAQIRDYDDAPPKDEEAFT
ncbi:hypothetical protein FEM48_Zijuj01G0039600 [Ziziphus jujuba var. spinosa]|uniref:Peptidase C1A papain C-terminal domain-containing protein n=1 Tax=Ziziphus jujuba var. spinosa TaxID=714518 RepID=A0A978VZ09_ZIZJJ|nr:hypothetical protein FEM48_Zijuj01G0039600 [Ziziphus jujuba var. spinosa]